MLTGLKLYEIRMGHPWVGHPIAAPLPMFVVAEDASRAQSVAIAEAHASWFDLWPHLKDSGIPSGWFVRSIAECCPVHAIQQEPCEC